MCLQVPGKIVKMSKDSVTVDYGCEKRVGILLDQECNVGDYVIIQGGFVVQNIPAAEAKRSLAMYQKAVSTKIIKKKKR